MSALDAAFPDCPELTNLQVAPARRGRGLLYARLGYADTGLRVESRYLYPDDAGVPREIVEHNILLVKRLDAEETDTASDGGADHVGLGRPDSGTPEVYFCGGEGDDTADGIAEFDGGPGEDTAVVWCAMHRENVEHVTHEECPDDLP